MDVSEGVATAVRWLGILLCLFAVVDVVLGRIFAIDITGVPWSPLVAGAIGGLLLRFVSGGDDE